MRSYLSRGSYKHHMLAGFTAQGPSRLPFLDSIPFWDPLRGSRFGKTLRAKATVNLRSFFCGGKHGTRI